MKISALALLIAIPWIGCQDRVVNSPQAEEGSGSETTPFKGVPFNKAGAPIVALSIPNMHCESCVAKTTEVLSKQSGVVEVHVDLDTKRATLAIDETLFDSQIVLDVLDDYGFKDSTILSEEGLADQ
jgi:copper chaperone CopZ